MAYDGTDFHGWQVQPGRCTIQGELQSALGRLVGETPLPQGSGRTDAGVHALAQVASFQLQAHIPPGNLLRALNRTLPGSIRILNVEIVPDSFHARHSAAAKTYEYRVLPVEPTENQICPPFLSRYVCPYSWRVRLELLNEAAQVFIGEHDFRSFAASDADRTTRTAKQTAVQSEVRETTRTILRSEWHEEVRDGFHFLIYRVRGNGFLHHMVRNLVGTMLDVGRGYLSPEELPKILAAKSRDLAGPTAPARGLFLHSVEYV